MPALTVARLVGISERHEKQILPRREQPRKPRQRCALLGQVQNIYDCTYVGTSGRQRGEGRTYKKVKEKEKRGITTHITVQCIPCAKN